MELKVACPACEKSMRVRTTGHSQRTCAACGEKWTVTVTSREARPGVDVHVVRFAVRVPTRDEIIAENERHMTDEQIAESRARREAP